MPEAAQQDEEDTDIHAYKTVHYDFTTKSDMKVAEKTERYGSKS